MKRSKNRYQEYSVRRDIYYEHYSSSLLDVRRARSRNVESTRQIQADSGLDSILDKKAWLPHIAYRSKNAVFAFLAPCSLAKLSSFTRDANCHEKHPTLHQTFIGFDF